MQNAFAVWIASVGGPSPSAQAHPTKTHANWSPYAGAVSRVGVGRYEVTNTFETVDPGSASVFARLDGSPSDNAVVARAWQGANPAEYYVQIVDATTGTPIDGDYVILLGVDRTS